MAPPRCTLLSAFILVFLLSASIGSSSSETNNSTVEAKGRPRKNPPPPPSPPPPPPPPPFDYYILELIWPQSFCSKLNHRPCRNSVPSRWTIHGLWPHGYEDCSPGDILDKNKIRDLDQWPDFRLSEKWPSLLRDIGNIQFWTHEWSKHGTCSGLAQHDYFEETMNLFDKIGPMEERLKTIQVKAEPGLTYDPKVVTTDYEKAHKKRPLIRCFDRTSSPHVEMIGSIRFKIYKNGTLDHMLQPTNCSTTTVEYPPPPPPPPRPPH